ncbi:MAG: hypothetical protein IT446_07030 [Phycisphaerales bacterium]|nr:hypothetical protein [Phycisphaerales bacterium]
MVANSPQETHPQLELLLASAGAKNRASIEKHLAACDAEEDPNHARLWRRLASFLFELAPLPIQYSPNAILFFIPDGRYRMQVFSLEDRRDGVLQLYLPDVLADALRKKILLKTGEHYAHPQHKLQHLQLLSLDASNTTDPATHVKNLIGWNRKALKITLQTSESDGPQVITAEALCALASEKWADKPKATAV